MAEALLRHHGGARFNARSAGFAPAKCVHPQILELLTQSDIDTSSLHTKSWQEFFGASRVFPVDVIVTLSEDARSGCPRWTGDPVRVHWPVDDPLATSNADMMEWKLRKCLATLENRITTFVKSRVAQSPSELLLQLKDISLVGA